VKISALQVDGFGVWSDLTLEGLSDELNVFYGPNEAGKTTLVEFVRSMFWGFSPQRRAQYLPPVRGGRPGGTLRAAVGERQYAVMRHADGGDPGEAVLTINNRPSTDLAGWSTHFGNVDETVFNNVYVFGLGEIQELGTLGDAQVADELYNLALGLDGVSLVHVLNEIDTSRTRLLAADDRPSLVAQLLSQRARLQSEIETLGQSTIRYLSLTTERERLVADIAGLEQESDTLERQSRELALARGLDERWRRRATIDERLRGLSDFDELPEDALATFEALDARLRARRRKRARLKDARRELRNQIQSLVINERLCRQAARLEALGEQQQWIASLEARLQEQEAQVAALEGERAEGGERLVAAKLQAQATVEPIDRHTIDELRGIARSLRAARREARQLRAKATSAGEAGETHARQLELAAGKATTGGLTEALAAAGELVSQFRARVQLEERLGQMTRRQSELEEQSQGHLDAQVLPAWILAAVGSVFVLGCALILLFLAGLVLPASISTSLGWPVALVGVLAVGGAAATKLGLERSAAVQLDGCHAQLQLLTQQIGQAKVDRDELDAKLPRGGGPLVARLQGAEKELARLEELLPLEAKREAARRAADAAAEQAAEKDREAGQLRKRWQRRLAENRLPADLSPKQLPDYFRRAQHLQGLERSLAQRREELGRSRADYDGLVRRIAQAVVDSGLTPRSQRPLEQLRECLAELAEQHAHTRRREELEREIDRLGRRYARFSTIIDRLQHKRGLLLRMAGTSDEDEFRRRAKAQTEARELVAERARLAQQIAATVAGHSTEDRIAQLVATPQTLEVAESQLAEARRVVSEKLTAALTSRGEIGQEIKTLVEDRQLAGKRVDLGIVEKRLRESIDRWRVLTLCRMMLSNVREYYEREHQPQTLQEASTYLKRMTSGRYTRVWTPLDEHSLRVDDAEGQPLPVEVLSRGTREQLFLALRLALVSAHARRGVRLPLVLDDVLVNFDLPRAKAAAIVLRDFARAGHQILIFTCHEHIARLFKQLKAEVRTLPENGRPQSAIEPARRARRPAELPVEPEPEPEPEPEYVEQTEPVLDEVEAPLAVEVVERPAAPVVVEALPPRPPEPAPRPAARPVRVARPRVERRLERVEWSAEEFAGELADRVRGGLAPWVRHGQSSEPQSGEPQSGGDESSALEDEDAEAA
jgi:uncharacterized protein YhaN